MVPGLELVALANQCAAQVHVITTQAIVRQESGGNPFAIGVVGGRLVRQPRALGEARATARELQANGWNFSVGLAQINVRNFARLGLTLESAFDPCRNLGAMQSVLQECWGRAKARNGLDEATTVRAALSCYYSGSFTFGQQSGYVDSVIANARVARAAAVRPPP